MIRVEGVSKSFGPIAALSDVGFEVGEGEVVGLLGPNGAGKTTLLRVLTGYFEPDQGRLSVDGVDVETDPIPARRSIGYLPEQAPVYPEMLVQDYLRMVAELRGLASTEQLRDAVVATGLQDHLTRPIGELSKGFRQRVGIAQAIVHRPRFLILDEPTSGLDPTQVDQVRRLIRELSRSTTVLFSTHVLSEVEQVCDRVLVLLGGHLRADARLAELQATSRLRVAVAHGPTPEVAVVGALRALPGVEGVEAAVRDGDLLLLELAGEAEAGSRGLEELARAVFRTASDQGWELAGLTPVVRNLEAVFRDLVREHQADVAPRTLPRAGEEVRA